MKPLISILLICSIGFTQELTVDGNLNVTGNIQNQIIDSLQQIIAGLQAQITALQAAGAGLETRIYALPEYNISPYQGEEIIFYLNDLTGVELDFARIRFHSLDDYTAYNNQGDEFWGFEFQLMTQRHMVYSGNDFWASDCSIGSGELKANNHPYILQSSSECFMHEHSRLLLNHGGSHGGGTYKFSVAITADFANAPIYQAPEPPQNSRTAP